MKTGAIRLLSSSARGPVGIAVMALVLASAPAIGQETKPVTAQDVAMTPLSDLNLTKDPIPQLLLDAQAEPYKLAGLEQCSDYVAAIQELDAVLGHDYDVTTAEQRSLDVGKVAQSLAGSFIPFRGVIREVSGANAHAAAFLDAIRAGMARRAFLKGIGLKQGCAYPARPADAETKARVQAEIAEAERLRKEEDEKD